MINREKSRHILSLLLFFCICASSQAQSIVIDTLSTDFIKYNKLEYETLTGIRGASGAVYSTTSSRMKSETLITMSKEKEAGFVTTASGGTVRRLVVEWDDMGTDIRSLDIYAKNSAYKSVGELYATNTQGTKIGSLAYPHGEDKVTELEIPGTYQYIGFRPKEKSMSFARFSIAWDTQGGTATETVSPPRFDLDEETVYTSPQILHISSDTENASIYYTLDGSIPSTSSLLYTEGIPLARTTTVKAVGIKEGLLASPVQTATFKFSDAPVSYNYKKVFSADELVAGDTYLIVNEKGGMAMGWQDTNNRKGAKITIEGGQIILSSTELASMDAPSNDGKVREFTLGGVTGAWTFKDEVEAGYLYAVHADKESGTTNYLHTSASNTGKSTATISFDESGNANVEFNKHTHNGRYRLLFNGDLFSCYNASSRMDSVQLYRRQPLTGTFRITAAGYATLYVDHAFVMPQGAQGGVVTASNNGKLAIDYCYQSGDIVPPNTGLLLKGKEDAYTYVQTATEKTARTDNLLQGTVDEQGYTRVEGEAKYYKLSYNNDNAELGFYWGTEGGGPFKNGERKAYLALKETQGGLMQAQGFPFEDLKDITAIESPPTTQTKGDKVYKIDGRRVFSTKNLPRGIYIINGKKALIR